MDTTGDETKAEDAEWDAHGCGYVHHGDEKRARCRHYDTQKTEEEFHACPLMFAHS